MTVTVRDGRLVIPTLISQYVRPGLLIAGAACPRVTLHFTRGFDSNTAPPGLSCGLTAGNRAFENILWSLSVGQRVRYFRKIYFAEYLQNLTF